MAIEDYYDQDVAILQVSRIPDGGGESTEVWNTIETVKGKKRTLKADEVKLHGKPERKVTDRLYLAYGTNILEVDRVLIEGTTYKIVAIDNPMSMNHHLEIDLKIHSE